MSSVLKESDLYIVYNNYIDYNFGRELNVLYLPLIGINSIKLYEYLFYKLTNEENLSEKYLHYDLTENLLLNTKQLLLARKKLEAIGLLKSYYHNENEDANYVYEIIKPLSFSEFFSTHLLSELLRNSIGEKEFEIIKNAYPTKKLSLTILTDVSAKFSDIFDYNESSFQINREISGPNLAEYYFDFNKLNSILSAKYIDVILEDNELRRVILELAHLYKVQSEDMAKAIENSIDRASGGDKIDIEMLKDYLNQLYINVRRNTPPTLDNMINRQVLKETYEENKELSKREKFAKKLENINYIDYLKEFHSIILSEVESKNTILKLQSKYNFPTGVLNVLLSYVIRQSGSASLPHFNYIDKIASSWSGHKLLTALDAMDFAKNENRKRSEFSKNNGKNYSKSFTKNYGKKEIATPDYIKEQLDDITSSKTTSNQSLVDDDFEEFLKERGVN